MIRTPRGRPVVRWWVTGCLVGLAWAGLAAGTGRAGPLTADREPVPDVLSLDAAVLWALQYNPELAALRQQHGIAAAGIVIARTYPFNPVYEAVVQYAHGRDIPNPVLHDHRVRLELEVRHQGTYRREGAAAALSRTDWEIASQEVALGIRVIRSFQGVLYRQEKLRLLQEWVRFNEQIAEQVRLLLQQGKVTGTDLILARTEITDTRAQVALGQTALVTARHELRRALGAVSDPSDLRGSLDRPFAPPPDTSLLDTARERRPDRHARLAAVDEAEARLRLTVADRFGNPSLAPDYQYNESRTNFIGAQISVHLSVLNTHKGEILQREAEKARAVLDLQQTEVQIQQDVDAALDRLNQARTLADVYRARVLPDLQTGLEDVERSFRQGLPGADVLRMIDVRRKLLRARDGYLDARWEVSQALADLAAAVGDPTLVIGPCSAPASPPAAAPTAP